MLQRLPIAPAQVQAGNISENVLNEICQLVYSLYQAKEITKKVYNVTALNRGYQYTWWIYLECLVLNMKLLKEKHTYVK